MSPVVLLLIGMLIVVLGILFLRLHAFLALILGSLVVAFLTSQESVQQHSIRASAVRVVSVDQNSNTIALKATQNQKIILATLRYLIKIKKMGSW